MTLKPDGTLQFAGGFAFFNPAHWQYADAQLRIELGGATPLPPAGPPAAGPATGKLLRVDAGKRTLVYHVTPETDALDLGGFMFYRKLACPAG